MPQPHLKLVAPSIQKRTVTPKRAKNADLRTREYLTTQEIDALMSAARRNRHDDRAISCAVSLASFCEE